MNVKNKDVKVLPGGSLENPALSIEESQPTIELSKIKQDILKRLSLVATPAFNTAISDVHIKL